MKIAVVDDSKLECLKLSDYIKQYCQIQLLDVSIDIFYDGENFLEHYSAGTYDIIFLDIYMKKLDGIETAEYIRKIDENCLIIFCSASKEHAVKSYRVRAFDYLLKPFQYESLEETMTLCKQALSEKARYIEVKEKKIILKVLLKDIIYADYFNHYIQIHTNERVIRSYMKFDEFSKLLLTDSQPQFLYCYRNCIINMDKITAVDHRDFVVLTGEKIPISRIDTQAIKQQYVDYRFNKFKS